MAASLVADYDSSNSESESETTHSPGSLQSTNRSQNSSSADLSTSVKVSYFAADDIAEDVSDSDVQHSSSHISSTETDAVKRLPNPLLDAASADDEDDCKSSVFVNYYDRAEQAKLAILEHHVKLSAPKTNVNSESSDSRSKVKRKRQICRNFQRGTCRYESKCRFEHSMSAEGQDAFVEDAGLASADKPSAVHSLVSNNFQAPLLGNYDQQESTPDDDEDEQCNGKRKIRCGVNDSLVPPKRAMKAFEAQRRQDRPWTVRPE